jgi:anaerobic magnesium-protoporphyrin IX monomethyl ester cyclase
MPFNQIRRVLLLNPPMRTERLFGSFAEFGSVSPPTGICYIAGFLRREGYEVSILDAEALRLDHGSTVDSILKLKPDIVGVTCKTAWINSAHKVATALKSVMPSLPIVAGGHHVTALPERTLNEFPAFDYLVIGEGERTFKELIEALSQGRDLAGVAGLAFRNNGTAILTPCRERIGDLDEIAPPAFDLLPDLKTHYWPLFNNIEKLPAFSIMYSRGCPGKCTFCDRGVFGNRVTRHSPEVCVSLIETLRRDHGIRYLVFDDDNLLLNKRYLLELLELMIERGVKVPFSCESRVDTLDEERLYYLKRAGCRQIMFGIETGSAKMLALMNKGITIDQIKSAVALTKSYGIKTLGYFMLGFPGETEETMQETVKLIKELKLFDVSAQSFTPLPGAEIYSRVVDSAEYLEDWDRNGCLDEVVYVPEGLTEEKIREYLDRCYDACYNRPIQWLLAPTRIHTMRHLKGMMRFYFGRKEQVSQNATAG